MQFENRLKKERAESRNPATETVYVRDGGSLI